MKLSVQIEFDKVLELETAKTSVTVGRSSSCDLVVNHESVSRQHCRVEMDGGQFYITDLESSNGVFLDGKRLTPNKKTPFIPGVTQVALGTLECEFFEGPTRATEDTQPHRIITATTSPDGDYTATIRLARLDINRELSKLPNRNPQTESEQKKKPAKPKNPISGTPVEEEVKESRLPSFKFLFMILILAGVAFVALNYFGILLF